MHCKKCGSENLDTAKFCNNCKELFLWNFTKKQKFIAVVSCIILLLVIIFDIIIVSDLFLNKGNQSQLTTSIPAMQESIANQSSEKTAENNEQSNKQVY